MPEHSRDSNRYYPKTSVAKKATEVAFNAIGNSHFITEQIRFIYSLLDRECEEKVFSYSSPLVDAFWCEQCAEEVKDIVIDIIESMSSYIDDDLTALDLLLGFLRKDLKMETLNEKAEYSIKMFMKYGFTQKLARQERENLRQEHIKVLTNYKRFVIEVSNCESYLESGIPQELRPVKIPDIYRDVLESIDELDEFENQTGTLEHGTHLLVYLLSGENIDWRYLIMLAFEQFQNES